MGGLEGGGTGVIIKWPPRNLYRLSQTLSEGPGLPPDVPGIFRAAYLLDLSWRIAVTLS